MAKAIEHLSDAFRFDLPERTSVDIPMWRGGSYEQLKQPRKALEDYLRGLVACSYAKLVCVALSTHRRSGVPRCTPLEQRIE
jgi:hypothetical protein